MSEDSYGLQTLHFNKNNGSFYMATVGSFGVSANAGVCNFLYRQ
jgi:hypothetical protein